MSDLLSPTQQSVGLVATTMMRSILDDVEEQRRKEEEQRTGKERDKVNEARISASEEAKRARDKITTALFSANHQDPNEVKIDLIERLGKKLGIDTDEARSNYQLSKALEDALDSMGTDDKSALEKDLGLDEMDISLTTLLGAIKNPYGDDNQSLMEGINRKINGGKLGTEVERVVQRLEDVADPKTLEELKLGPQGTDPTRVNDDEAKQERKADIEAAEAGRKLEDVQKVQDAVAEKNDKVDDKGHLKGDTKTASGKDGDTAPVDDGGLLEILAAAAEQPVADTAKASDSNTDDADTAADQTSDMVKATNDDLQKVSSETVAKAIEGASQDQLANTLQPAILPVRVDDIGLYELLKEKKAA